MIKDTGNLLFVEDDPSLGLIVKDSLELNGYRVSLCRDGEQGLNLFHRLRFDLCLIDVMLPKLDGFSLAEKIRKNDQRMPVIFLTAKSMKEDRIKGFKIGADDYITKPFSIEELLLRIEAVLRRARGDQTESEEIPVCQIGNYHFDYQERLLKHKKHVQKLTHKENELLHLLCRKMNKVLERDYTLIRIWGSNTFYHSRSMDVYITRLRKYLDLDERIQLLNVHGEGFTLIVKERVP